MSIAKELIAGSGVEFDDVETHRLKGVAGQWRTHAVADASRRK